MFACETFFKDAANLIDQLSKKIIEMNNGLNDFHIEVKQGLHLYQNHDEITQSGKYLIDQNNSDRKLLKSIEDQNNILRKTLHRIRAALGEQEQLKASKSMTTG